MPGKGYVLKPLNFPHEEKQAYYWSGNNEKSAAWDRFIKRKMEMVAKNWASQDDGSVKTPDFTYDPATMHENVVNSVQEAMNDLLKSDQSEEETKECIKKYGVMMQKNTVLRLPPTRIVIKRGKRFYMPKEDEKDQEMKVDEGTDEVKLLPLVSICFNGNEEDKSDPFFRNPALWPIVQVGPNLQCLMDVLTIRCLDPRNCKANFLVSEIGAVLAITIIPKDRRIIDLLKTAAAEAKKISDAFTAKARAIVDKNPELAKKLQEKIAAEAGRIATNYSVPPTDHDLRIHAMEVMDERDKPLPATDSTIPEEDAVKINLRDEKGEIVGTEIVSKGTVEAVLNATSMPPGWLDQLPDSPVPTLHEDTQPENMII